MRRLLTVCVVLVSLGSSAEALARAKKRKPGVREKILSGEQTVRGDQREVNFGDAQINGAPKSPLLDNVRAGGEEKSYDFVKLRFRWHPEMLQSANALTSP